MQVGIVGVNHKCAELGFRDEVSRVCLKLFASKGFSSLKHQFILLQTCNRIEIYFSSCDLIKTHCYLKDILSKELSQYSNTHFYTHFSMDCFLHLARVTAGVDSAIIGENEIQGQVKRAYKEACDYFSLSKDLHFLFQKSLKIAKDVRTFCFGSLKRARLESVIKDKISKYKECPRILILGASEINLSLMAFLRKKTNMHLLLSNRCDQKAVSLSKTMPVEVLPWSDWPSYQNYDVMVLATRSPNYLVEPSHFYSQKDTKKLVIDLGVPRNANPSIHALPHVELINIDQLTKNVEDLRLVCEREVKRAQSLIVSNVSKLVKGYIQKKHLSLSFA